MAALLIRIVATPFVLAFGLIVSVLLGLLLLLVGVAVSFGATGAWIAGAYDAAWWARLRRRIDEHV